MPDPPKNETEAPPGFPPENTNETIPLPEPDALPEQPSPTEDVKGIAGSATEATAETPTEPATVPTPEATPTASAYGSQESPVPSEVVSPIFSGAFSANAASSITSILLIFFAFF